MDAPAAALGRSRRQERRHRLGRAGAGVRPADPGLVRRLSPKSISPYTGELLGRMEIPDGTYIAPVVANGTLYLYTNDAQLVALR